MRRSDYTASNRQAWEEAAPVHRRHRFAQLLSDFSRPGHSCLDAIATGMLRSIGVHGRRVVQVCCNNGRELISVANMGASRCIGFDISPAFIEQARELNSAARAGCEFVCSDIYEIPRQYNNSAELVYISVGSLGWLPDLPGAFAVIRRLLRPRGWLAMYEMHPILGMFETEDQNPPPLRYPYFQSEPLCETDGLDYLEGTVYESSPSYWFQHTLSDVIGGALEAGFILDSFREYDHDISAAFAYMEKYQVRPPLCFTLTARLGGKD